MRTLTASVSLLSILLSSTPALAASSSSSSREATLEGDTGFPDVSSFHRNADAIAYVHAREFVSGYPDGTFRPDNTINRAEFVKILIGTTTYGQGADCNMSQLKFTDVRKDDWYAAHLCFAQQLQYVGGYPDGSFRGWASISFVEAAKILSQRYALGAEERQGQPWYKPYVETLAEKNAIPLTIAKFDQPITRAEMAEMIYRLHGDFTQFNSRTYEDLAGAQWKTFTNTRYDYSIEYMNSMGLMSNSFATEPEEAGNVVVGPIDFSVRDPRDYDYSSNYKEEYEPYMKKTLPDYAQAMWELNNADDMVTVGPLETTTVNGRTAYKFWVEGAYTDYLGGWIVGERTYVTLFDIGKIHVHATYANRDAEVAETMFATFKTY